MHGTAYGSSTQPANFTKVKQIAVLRVDIVNQCLKLAVIQAAGEDGVDDLHHNRNAVNEVGRLGAQSLLVHDAVHLVYGLSVSGGLTVAGVSRAGLQCYCRAGWRAGRLAFVGRIWPAGRRLPAHGLHPAPCQNHSTH